MWDGKHDLINNVFNAHGDYAWSMFKKSEKNRIPKSKILSSEISYNA